MSKRPKASATEIAKRQRYKVLAEKLKASIEQGGPRLTRAEAKDLERIESELRANEPDRRWIVTTQQEAARFFGITSATLRDWFETGCPRKNVGGRSYEYDLSAIAIWRHDRDLSIGGNGSNDAKRELDKLRADRLRLKVAIESGETASIEEVVRDLRELYTATKTGLLSARAEFPPEFQDQYDEIVRASLAGVVADLQNRLRSREKGKAT